MLDMLTAIYNTFVKKQDVSDETNIYSMVF